MDEDALGQREELRERVRSRIGDEQWRGLVRLRRVSRVAYAGWVLAMLAAIPIIVSIGVKLFAGTITLLAGGLARRGLWGELGLWRHVLYLGAVAVIWLAFAATDFLAERALRRRLKAVLDGEHDEQMALDALWQSARVLRRQR